MTVCRIRRSFFLEGAGGFGGRTKLAACGKLNRSCSPVEGFVLPTLLSCQFWEGSFAIPGFTLLGSFKGCLARQDYLSGLRDDLFMGGCWQ
jgi:hypothetical protein